MKTQPLKENSAPAESGSDSTFGSVFGDAGGSEGGGTQFGATSFGDTNAVTDIFKGTSSGADDKKKKLMVIGLSVLAILGCLLLGAFLLMDSGAEDEDEVAAEESAPEVVVPSPVAAAPSAEEAATAEEDAVDEPEAEAPVAVGSADSYTYNERDGGPVVSAKDGAVIEVSRDASFSGLYVTGVAKGGQFRIPNPPPGKIFWREQGGAEAHKITVAPPPRLAVSFASPGKVAAGGSLSWSSSGSEASFYRVEFATDAEFNNIAAVVSTKGNSAKLSTVGAGSYHVRVGGFNEAAGRWDYSRAATLEVQ